MQGTPRPFRRDLLCIVLVLLVGLAVKSWLFLRTEVLARDGVGYIRFAASLHQEPWPNVLRSEQQHPLYPIAVAVTHELFLAANIVTDSPIGWQSSAQAVSLICGLLLAVPMFFLARRLFGSRVAFWATLTFQVLPVPAQITTDTLSEGLFLLASASALLAAVIGLERRYTWAFAITGIFGGLAYLTRPEGAILIALAALMVLWLQISPTQRMPWRKALACWGGLSVAILVALPYWLTIGGLSNKPASREFFKPLQESLTQHVSASPRGGSLLLASRFTDGVDGRRLDDVGPLYALGEVLDEVCKAFNYAVWIPVVLGLPWYARRFASSPGVLLLTLLIVVQFLVLWLLAYRVRYVSERHTLLIVLVGCILSMATLFHWAEQLPTWWRALPFTSRFTWVDRFLEPNRLRIGMEAAFVVAVALGLTQTLKIPHQHRVGHKLAGLWLQQHMQPCDKLVDPYGWASFYAGRFVPPSQSQIRSDSTKKPRRFVVVDPADQDLHRRRLIDEELAGLKPSEPVFAWPGTDAVHLIIYAGVKQQRNRSQP